MTFNDLSLSICCHVSLSLILSCLCFVVSLRVCQSFSSFENKRNTVLLVSHSAFPSPFHSFNSIVVIIFVCELKGWTVLLSASETQWLLFCFISFFFSMWTLDVLGFHLSAAFSLSRGCYCLLSPFLFSMRNFFCSCYLPWAIGCSKIVV